uniref:Uncharacterized protein n=1 Tax=Rhizophora mucronata TaxID=61149 RepID=A0A2P2IJ15_RHIMU
MCLIYVNSQGAWSIALYSVYALDIGTSGHFLLFHKIRLRPKDTQYPLLEFLSMGDPM